MPEPAVITQANAFRAALLRREAAQMRAMTRQWLVIERALQDGIADTLREIDFLRTQENVRFSRNPDPYLQLEQYRALLRQTRAELAKFAEFAETDIRRGIDEHARLGVEQSNAQIDAITSTYNRMSVPAVENLVGVLQDGAPVGDLLRRAFPDAAVQMTDALITGTALGWNPRKTAAAMVQGLQQGALQRAMVIARTEQLRALRTAQMTSYRESAVVVQWMRIASKSPRTCLACLIADGTFYELESEFDAHPQCVIEGTIVSTPPIQGTSKRLYDGPVVDIVTVRGNHLTVTPNHPVLTDHGWVAARLLKVGDNVISSRGGEWSTLLVDPNQQQGPARIEDIVSAFNESLQVSTVSMPTTAVDFHGDGIDSDVCVIGTNSLLRNRRQPALLQPPSERFFLGGSVSLGGLLTQSALGEIFDSARAAHDGRLCDADASQVLFLGGLGGEQLVGFGLAADGDASFNQIPADDVACYAVFASNGVFGFPRQVGGNHLVGGEANEVLIAVDPSPGQVAVQGGPTDTVSLQNDRWFDPADVVIDRIVDYSQRHFSGHVYNLQTVTGWYVANGIITHNCRCTLIPVLKGREPPAFTRGRAWLEAQPAAKQQQVMGVGAWRAWQDGAVTLDDLVTRHEHPVWGASLGQRALRDVLGAETARQYSTSAFFTQYD